MEGAERQQLLPRVWPAGGLFVIGPRLRMSCPPQGQFYEALCKDIDPVAKELVCCFPDDAGMDSACFKLSYDVLLMSVRPLCGWVLMCADGRRGCHGSEGAWRSGKGWGEGFAWPVGRATLAGHGAGGRGAAGREAMTDWRRGQHW
jgi:hypothetical protein